MEELNTLTKYLGLKEGKQGYAAYQEVIESPNPGACVALRFVHFNSDVEQVIAFMNARAKDYPGRIHVVVAPYSGCPFNEKACTSIVLETLPFDYKKYQQLMVLGMSPLVSAQESTGDKNLLRKQKPKS